MYSYILYIFLRETFGFVLEFWKTFVLLSIFVLLHIWHNSKINNFKNRGIKYKQPYLFIGNLGSRLSNSVSFYESQLEVYNYFKGERYGGYFEGNRPLIYLIDPDLIKAVTIKDFDYFVNRIVMSSRNKRYIKRIILDLKDDEWRTVRSLVTPTFSSFRLKNMYPLMQESSTKLLTYLDKIDRSAVEMKDLFGLFTLDVIGACAFGIDSCFIENDNSDFIKAAQNYNKMSAMKRLVITMTMLVFPGLFKYMSVSCFDSDAVDVLIGILKEAKAERRSVKTERSDFLQLLIDAAVKERDEKKGSIELDDDTIDAQALIFLLAGYETSSTLLSFAAHTLAAQPALQERLRAHVRGVVGDGPVGYDQLAELDFLEGVLLETSRMYPPFPRFERVCVKPYTLPGTNLRINVGEVLAMPVAGIQMDPDLYPEPEKFIPERFTKEERNKRPSHHHLTFGSGPRNCIGMRFAMVSMKLAMCILLINYKLSPCSKTDIPIKISKKSFILKTENGVWLKMDKIK